ncbi:DUF4145 domain-containing protein [bacterium]|nr:DUF4145 domain-containing protein [bacterium]
MEISKIKAHCNSCKQETNHDVKAEYTNNWQHEDEYNSEQGWITYQVISCCGCDQTKFLMSEQSSYDVEHYTNHNGEHETHFPTKKTYFPENEWREMPKWVHHLYSDEGSLYEIYSELYLALRSNLIRLAGMASRSAIEQILNKTVGEEKSPFDRRLQLLVDNNFIATSELETLKTALDFGNATTHRSWKPKKEDLSIALDIIENLMHRIYVLAENAKTLQPKIPPKNK